MALALLVISLASIGGTCDPSGLLLPWQRHTIDDTFRGADGVKLSDVNSDGLVDLVVPWEESGRVVVYLHPGTGSVRHRWPSVVVGTVGSPEDAVFVDLDGDGMLDVVSACEGSVRTMFVHWAPSDPARLLDPGAWQTEAIPATAGRQQWMFCEPAQIDGLFGVDLVAGGKGSGAQIGYLSAPADPRSLIAWTWRPLADVAWVMSIIPIDLDGDGHVDIFYTDRKGSGRGVYWLENPGDPVMPWQRHFVASASEEIMFADLRQDGETWEAAVATDGHRLLLLRPGASLRQPWSVQSVSWPTSFGTGKGVRFGDVTGDGRMEIVFSCESASRRQGMGLLTPFDVGDMTLWTPSPLGDQRGSKFDLVQLADLTGDGNLDVLTTEESTGLGVVWYENRR